MIHTETVISKSDLMLLLFDNNGIDRRRNSVFYVDEKFFIRDWSNGWLSVTVYLKSNRILLFIVKNTKMYYSELLPHKLSFWRSDTKEIVFYKGDSFYKINSNGELFIDGVFMGKLEDVKWD